MSARASVAFITDQVEEIKQRQFVDLVPGIVQVSDVTDLTNVASPKNVKSVNVIFVVSILLSIEVVCKLVSYCKPEAERENKLFYVKVTNMIVHSLILIFFLFFNSFIFVMCIIVILLHYL